MGWGMEVKMAQREATHTRTPRGISTRDTASPSAMLCTPKASATQIPNLSPPPKATPWAIPSVAEWMVITPMNINALVPETLSIPRTPLWRWPKAERLTTMKPKPTSAPIEVLMTE